MLPSTITTIKCTVTITVITDKDFFFIILESKKSKREKPCEGTTNTGDYRSEQESGDVYLALVSWSLIRWAWPSQRRTGAALRSSQRGVSVSQ